MTNFLELFAVFSVLIFALLLMTTPLGWLTCLCLGIGLTAAAFILLPVVVDSFLSPSSYPTNEPSNDLPLKGINDSEKSTPSYNEENNYSPIYRPENSVEDPTKNSSNISNPSVDVTSLTY